jgi:hypothetical protein
MKNLIKTLALALFMGLNLSAFSQTSDFSGTWNLNEEKSKMGESPSRMAPVKIVINHKGNHLSLETTRVKPDGEKITSVEKYTLDGAACENNTENRMKKSTALLVDSVKTINIKSQSEWTRNGNKINFSLEEVFTLSKDGKTLVVDTKSSSTRGEFQAILEYDKAD